MSTSTEEIEVWMTKYALSRGIKVVRGEVSKEHPGYFRCKFCSDSFYDLLGPKEWHLTEESAIQRVLKMIASRRSSILREIKKLDDLEVLYKKQA